MGVVLKCVMVPFHNTWSLTTGRSFILIELYVFSLRLRSEADAEAWGEAIITGKIKQKKTDALTTKRLSVEIALLCQLSSRCLS